MTYRPLCKIRQLTNITIMCSAKSTGQCALDQESTRYAPTRTPWADHGPNDCKVARIAVCTNRVIQGSHKMRLFDIGQAMADTHGSL